MKIKNIILTIVFSIAILFISLTNVKAVTITETTEDDKYDTIADNTIIIGITKFEPNEVLTAGKASLATFNDFIFSINGEAYELPKIYYYLQGSWFIIDNENQASVVEDKKELENLKSQDIYYVNNEEKMLEVPYEIGLEKGHELVFKSNDSGKDEQIQYKDGVIHIPATLHTVTVAIKETATGAMTEVETLTKTEDNNTAFKSSTAEVATIDELKAALEDKAVTKIILNADIKGLTETFTISRTMEFDGKGHTITGNKNIFHVLGTETTLTIDNVKLVANDNATAIKVGDQNLGTDKHLKAVIGKDVEITSKYFGVTVFGENSTVDFYGKINITDDGYGISGNGLEKYAGKTTVNVKEGAEIVSNNGGYALYLPQDGTANIEGGKLEGSSVVAVKSGTLNVTGGILKATGEKVALPSASYNGKTSTGDVIAVEVNESYAGGKTNKNIKINVTGGTLESANAYIIREVNVDSSDIEIEVTGLYNIKNKVAENVNIYGTEVEVASVSELKSALNDINVTEVNITKNVEVTEALQVNHTVTVNGNGKTITGDNVNLFHVTGTDTVLTINNANLVATENGTAVKVGDKNLGKDKHLKAVIGKDVKITSKYFGVTVFGENSTVDFYGKINITDDGYGIAGNGLEEYSGKTIINIKEGSEIKANGETGFALYLPQDGTVNIEGGKLEGASVVGLKAGKLNITGGTLKATGVKVALPSASYNGKAQTGDVIAVEVNESYAGGKTDKNIQINVTEGATLESANAYVIREVNVDKSDIGIEVTGVYSAKTVAAENVNIYGKEAEVSSVANLKSALSNKDITEINITEDVEIAETLQANHTVTVNGNGKTITGDNVNLFHVTGTDTVLTINNAKLVATENGTAVKVGDKNLGTDKKLKAVIGKDVKITSKYFGVTVFGENSTVDFYGTINITDDGYGIAGNGLEEYAGKTIINIKEGSEIKANTEKGIALYLPQDGTVNIEGGTLEGASVVAIKSGALNITGGTLTATGAKVELPSASYNGKTQTGDVIAVEVNESYAGGQTDKNIKINVTGGTLTSKNAYRIREVNVDSSDITIDVRGLYSVKNSLSETVNVYEAK